MSAATWIFYLAFYVLSVAGLWMMFVKAGEEGWKALIPIWNTLVLLKIVGRPWWWIILFLIPIVGFVMWIIVANDTSKSFGRGAGTTVGLVFLTFIFTLIIGFGSSEYQGPSAAPAGASGSAGSEF
jgi:hypothetical protein